MLLLSRKIMHVQDVISKRQQAAQEAMRKVDELRNQEIRRREAQVASPAHNRLAC